ncbi:MAG: zinc-dependent metalloprotease [Actinomycetota bacterium]
MARLIEPAIARPVARRFAGTSAVAGSYLMDRLQRDLESAVPRSEELVARASGIPAPPPVRWAMIDRAEWAEANIIGMGKMIQPLADRINKRLEAAPAPVRIAQRTLVSVEAGMLLGYVSRRVLGQYDVLVPDDAERSAPRSRWRRRIAEGTPLYFVGTNIVETERRLGFVPEDFALWVAVHEVTHRFQFAGVPWLKERFFGLVESYLGSIDLDARGLAGRLSTAARRMASGAVSPEERNPVYLLASEEQKRMLDGIQALMAVVEGHGNYVMDAVGAEVIPSFGRMRRVFEQRRAQTNLVQKVLNNVIGLEMKLRQYELGQRFCERVVAEGGPQALAHLWSDPQNFPTLEELRDAPSWLRRVA